MSLGGAGEPFLSHLHPDVVLRHAIYQGITSRSAYALLICLTIRRKRFAHAFSMSIDHWPSAITMGLQSAVSQSEMSPFLVQAHPPDRLAKCGTHQVEELGIDLLLHVEVAEDQEVLGQLGRVVEVVHDKLHQVHHALPVPLELSVQR